MKQFEYNEHGVCTNPNIYFQDGGSDDYLIEVITALGKHGWVYGMNFRCSNSVGGCGCWRNDKEAYMTEEEAGKAGLRFLRRKFEVSFITSDKEICSKAFAAIEEALKAKRLSLFDEI